MSVGEWLTRLTWFGGLVALLTWLWRAIVIGGLLIVGRRFLRAPRRGLGGVVCGFALLAAVALFGIVQELVVTPWAGKLVDTASSGSLSQMNAAVARVNAFSFASLALELVLNAAGALCVLVGVLVLASAAAPRAPAASTGHGGPDPS